ncbi:MAG TPA: efflux RND transporter permease subunit [Candidatus Dormibacteraeota bacterium]|nr:efflux RND transporter permease subunit [Candidatus Dormibacteraeota bacterium]
MIRPLVEFSLRYRGVVIALACLLLIYGLNTAVHAKLDVFPEFAPPQVVIQTEAPGLASEQVEQLVTRPIELAVNGVANLESIRSQSIQGLSVITAVFQGGTDIYRARQMVSERLSTAASQLPQGVRAPQMAPLTSATSMILDIGLTSEKRSLMELRTFADWTLRPRLLAVPGVANVVIFGGEVRQLQIQLRQEKLLAYGISIDDVLAAARNATGVRGAGVADTPNQRIVLRSDGQQITPDELGGIVLLQQEGVSVRLRDVAQVVEAPEPMVGAAAIQGTPGVILVVSSQYGANTLEVTQGAERTLEELAPAAKAENIVVYPRLFRPASFIETAVENVRTSLLIGGVLVAVVLFLFLLDLRTSFISLTAIPLSLFTAVIVLDRFGATLNTLTIGGLAIAIGEVVDDAIIDVENIIRRLRENRSRPDPLPVFQVVLDASLEIRKSVVYATWVVALVFLPVLTMSGVQGRIFAPLGIAYILAIIASLLVALTVTPALSFALLTGRAEAVRTPRYIDSLKTRYRSMLENVARRPRLILGIVIGLCVAVLGMLPFFGGAFLPELREGHFIVHMSAIPGTSLDESLRIGRAVSQELLKNPHIRSVAQRVGRAELADDTWGTHYSEFGVDLVPLKGEEAEQVQSEIRNVLTKFPGVYFAIKPFLEERIEEILTGVSGQVVIKIFGNDLDQIDRSAQQVARVLASVKGAADVQVESQPGMPEMVMHLRPERLLQFGFQPVSVMDAVQTAYQGTTVSQTYEGDRVFAVNVILNSATRRNPEDAGSLMLDNAGRTRIPLRELADIYETTGRYVVLHEATRRRQSVTSNVAGRDVASFVAEARKRIESEIRLPSGVYLSYSGAAEAQAAAQRDILLTSGIAGVGIVLLLAIAFGNFRNLLLVLANLPFALAGGVLAIFFSGGWLTLGSLVGLVTLFGISTRNSIMMVSHFDHLVKVEGHAWGLETALQGASERLVPILMTALVAGLGLLPIAIGSGDPGREIEGPMAIVILGGLATSTALNLLILPTLALRFGRFEASA